MRLLVVFACCLLQCNAFCKEVTLLLIRHGETNWNLENRVQGQVDNPLNEKGVLQAKATAERLFYTHPDVVAIYSSDLSRAYETARISAEKLGLPIHIEPRLREIQAGIAEGMKREEKVMRYQKLWDELKQKYPDKRERWKYSPIPGEETTVELIRRIEGALRDICQQVQDHAKVAIFSHKKAIQAVLADIEDKETDAIEILNCEIVPIFYNSDDPTHPFYCQKVG